MTLHRSNKMTLWLLAAAFSILAGAILATGAMTAPAEAQDPAGSINNLLVSSPNPGQLVMAWDSPAEVPKDYRVRWTPSDQDYLSWSAENTAERGSAYPTATTHTVDGLTAGTEYKVQVRARYLGNSGPWTDEANATVSSTVLVEDDPPPPLSLTIPQHPTRPRTWPSRTTSQANSPLPGTPPPTHPKTTGSCGPPSARATQHGLLRTQQRKGMPTQQERPTPSPT